MEETPSNQVDDAQNAKNPNRRKILKLLAAGGAVTAATMLPGKWRPPVVKSGVLPAHAQVTPTPTPTPTPQEEYEIRCGQWDWEFFEDEVSYYEFSGSPVAWDVTNNVPLPNVRLIASALIAPATFRSDFGDTDANGVANITIQANVQDVQLPTIEITVEFDQSGLYDGDPCTTTVPLPQVG